jgi:hypothetical protein
MKKGKLTYKYFYISQNNNLFNRLPDKNNMEKEILSYIKDNLELFGEAAKASENKFLKTRDARAVFTKTINRLSEGFVFPSTKSVWKTFPFSEDANEIRRRQEFFENSEKKDNSFLTDIKIPKKTWKPKYGVIVVTEDDKTFLELQKLNCPVKIISSEQDLPDLENYDIVQAVDCEDTRQILETLPQSVFLDSAEEAYLERFLQELSAWIENINVLKENQTNETVSRIISELEPLAEIMEDEKKEKLTGEKAEKAAEQINREIEEEISRLNISGTQLMSILNQQKLPENIEEIKEKAVNNSNIPEHIFQEGIPVKINEAELEKFLKIQDAEEHTSVAEKIKRNSEAIIRIPEKLKQLEAQLILFDFLGGLDTEGNFPEISEEFYFEESTNLFLTDAQAISFHLDEKSRCSILTGANSGGKTTLLEHVIQLITLSQLGLPIKGKVKIPVFSEIYYFAKNKGESGKGAFENLLSQMDKIKTGNKTLILADEIESVTEPGVAGKIISATCEYFIQKGCFMIVATHLGQEIQKEMPPNSRMDGIEAKGLDEYFELVVDHNPVLGRLANSTPELIIQKLAQSKATEYYKFLNEKVKKEN